MPAERFDFPNAAGQKLAALLDRPPGEPRAYALFAHCFTCGKDVHAAKRIAEGLTALDTAVLRFDFTGLGSSDGEFANTTFSSNVADLVAAANELRRTRRAPAILIGHSLGGTAVLAAASDVPEARAVVTIAASLLYFAFGLTGAAYLLIGALVVFATLESVFGICVGCKAFAVLMRLGVIPQSVCEECNDLGLRWRRLGVNAD